MKSTVKKSGLFLFIFATIGFTLPDELNMGLAAPDWEVVCDQEWSRYGDGISSGDLNGDGFEDVAVGAPVYEPHGAVFIYNGSASGPSTIPDKVVTRSFYFGNRVDCKGDVNNDGFNDMVTGNFVEDSLYVYHGSASGLSDTPTAVIGLPGQGGNSFAFCVASADVNGDGYSDVIANCRDVMISGRRVGAYIFLGSVSGTESTPAWSASIDSTLAENDFGSYDISNAGDVNGDGFEEVIVGGGWSNVAAVYYGAETRGYFQDPDKIYFGQNYLSQQIGWSVSGNGDLNGDGFDDVISGFPGSVYAFLGSIGGLSDTPVWSKVFAGNTCFAYRIATGYDFNNDGFDELFISNCDSVHIYFGKSNGLTTDPVLINNWAYSVAAGNVNGDSFGDLLIGKEPRAYGYFGEQSQIASLRFLTRDTAILDPDPQEFCIEIEVTDQFGMPLPGIGVQFTTIGIGYCNFDGYGSSDSNGAAHHCTVVAPPCFDTIIASAAGFTDTLHLIIDVPLPADLAMFIASEDRNDVVLDWSTTAELNNSGFEIQRAVQSGKLKVESELWSMIGFVNGGGTTNEPKEYSFTDRNLETGKYKYRLKQIDFNGNFEYFELAEVVSIGIPDKYDLSQNYPNPFNPVTTINYDLPNEGVVNIKVYDMLGREVKMLVNEMKTAGYHKIQFSAADLSSGAYFYRMTAGDFVAVKIFVVLK